MNSERPDGGNNQQEDGTGFSRRSILRTGLLVTTAAVGACETSLGTGSGAVETCTSLAETPVRPVTGSLADNIVETTSGKVRGYRDQAVRIFQGVPYGRSPVGAARFLPARPPEPWAGTLDTTTPPAVSPQRPLPEEALKRYSYAAEWRALMRWYDPPFIQDEDCLRLNIWTPVEKSGRKRPVFVRIHGGGFGSGGCNSGFEDGTNMAAQRDVVYVSLGHRLGALGYLYLGDILGEQYSAANPGMLDIVLALEWIRDNIEAFGGDPGNVTLSGFSGGGKKISHLLAMPSANGLFHKAIIESGALHHAIERDAASEYTLRFLNAVGLSRNEAHKLKEVPVETLLKTTSDLSRAGLDARGSYGGTGGPQPLVDGNTLPMHPGPAVAAGASADIPVIIGSNLDEGAGAQLRDSTMAMTWEDARKRLTSGAGDYGVLPLQLGDKVGEVVEHYRAIWPELAPGELTLRIEAAATWRHESIRMGNYKVRSAGAPVYMYICTWQSNAYGGFVKATHGVNVGLELLNIDRGGAWMAENPTSHIVSASLNGAWTSMAEHGNPNHPSLPVWTPWSQDKRSTMLFDTESLMVDDPYNDSTIFG